MVGQVVYHLYMVEDHLDHIKKGYKRVSQAHAWE